MKTKSTECVLDIDFFNCMCGMENFLAYYYIVVIRERESFVANISSSANYFALDSGRFFADELLSIRTVTVIDTNIVSRPVGRHCMNKSTAHLSNKDTINPARLKIRLIVPIG